ncbi:efflux transporter outer membrane subunit [Acinetobacter sp. c1-l78]|uniref:efflux transporter outer membrane subunit n=1 Tax=Acinetobacter sp. c1-l78 TaxID=3342803 RepID=UPI0035B7D248
MLNIHQKKSRLFNVLFIASVLSACQSHLPQRPNANITYQIPQHFQNHNTTNTAQPTALCQATLEHYCQAKWWTQFDDSRLNAYVENVLARNSELATATITLQKALQNLEKEKDSRFPHPSLTGGANRGGTYQLKTGESSQNSQFNLNLGANWELDLWGKLKLQRDMASWEKDATIADRQAVYMNLTATAVRNYLALSHINQRLAYNKETENYHAQQRKFMQVRLKAGLSAPADMLSIEQSINQHQQQRLNLLQQKNEALNNLAILLNRSVSELPTELVDSQFNAKNLPAIPVALPADVIANRPDMQAASSRLQSALAQPELSKKSLYPNIVLTAGAGASSNQLIDLLKVPVLNWGLALNLPSINKKDIDRTLQTAELNREQAVLNYYDALYKALADVEVKLSHYQTSQKAEQLLRQSQTQAKKQLDYMNIRYKAGMVAYKDVVDAQESYRQSEISFWENQYNQYYAWIVIKQALGG